MRPEQVPGLIPASLGEALAALAEAVPADQCIVEVGSFKGRSTAYLASGAKRGLGAHVYAVDPWDLQPAPGKHDYNAPSVREAFEANLKACRLWSRVTPIRAYSADVAAAWDAGPIGLLYLDGDHEEGPVRADVAAWSPHLAPGAVIAFDDWGTRRNPGVAVVAAEAAAKAGTEVEVQAGRLAVVRLP